MTKEERQYSTMQKEFHGITKKLIKKHGESRCMRHLMALAEREETGGPEEGPKQIFLQIGGCYIRYLTGGKGKDCMTTDNPIKILHCFIETEELFDFLKTSDVKELQLANKFIKKYGTAYHGPGMTFDDKAEINKIETKDAFNLKIAIHHKRKTEGSILVDASFILNDNFSSFIALQDYSLEMGTNHYYFEEIDCLSEINKRKESNQKLRT